MSNGEAPFAPDGLDKKTFDAFPGLVMRKDLTGRLRGMSKAPSYVLEFMLGKYCSDLFDEAAVSAGLELVAEEVARYIPKGDETEVIKASIRQRPPRRLIDLVQVNLDERLESGVYWAHLVSANIPKVNINDKVVEQYERLLTAGIWSNVLVTYDDSYRYKGQTFPFVIQRLEPVQVGHVDLDEYIAGRAQYTRDEWIDLLVRTMGYEPTHPEMTQRVKLLYLLRMVPLVEPNYHMIELGPRQTGKSFCFTEMSPYGTLLAGGAVTVPKLFVTTAGRSQPGLIRSQDVIGFDEIAGSTFNRDDDKNLYKDYMEFGKINRGTVTVAGDAGFVFNGNINFDPREGMQLDHLFKPLPPSVSDDTAFHDRWSAYLPGWEMPKLTPEMLTTHVGFILDYVSELFHRELRQNGTYATLWEQWFERTEGEWSVRDKRSVDRTFSGLAKLIFPGRHLSKDDARLLLEVALELRLRIRMQLHAMNAREFQLTSFSFLDKETGEVHTVRCAV